MLIPLVAVGALALFALAASKVSAHIEPEQPPPLEPFPIQEPLPIPRQPLPEMPRVIRDSDICKVFVVDTTDARIGGAGLRQIKHRYRMAAEWVRRNVGTHVAYDPEIIVLRSELTATEIRQIVLYGNLPAELFSWLEYAYGGMYNPYDPSLVGKNQTWQFIIRGAGGYAGAINVRYNLENVGWGIVGDAVLSSWLSEVGLERNIAPDVIFIGDCDGRGETDPDYEGPCMSLSDRQFYGSPDAQTGAFIHETFHAMFWAGHTGENSIMTSWWNWPDNNIDSATADLILPDSPYLL
jgi:hypothetical protein